MQLKFRVIFSCAVLQCRHEHKDNLQTPARSRSNYVDNFSTGGAEGGYRSRRQRRATLNLKLPRCRASKARRKPTPHVIEQRGKTKVTCAAPSCPPSALSFSSRECLFAVLVMLVRSTARGLRQRRHGNTRKHLPTLDNMATTARSLKLPPDLAEVADFARELLAMPEGPTVTTPAGISRREWFERKPQAWLKPFTGTAKKPLHRLRGLYADDVARLTRDAVTAHLAGIQAASNALGHTTTKTTKDSYLSA